MILNTLINMDRLPLFQTLFGNNIVCTELAATWISILTVTIVLCFVISELTNNYSQVDKIWSIMPIIYSIVTLSAFPTSPRIWIMTSLVTFWGLRLSYNFYRKGGYNIIPWKGEEDYRWAILRENPLLKGRFRNMLFNLIFISIYQQVLIMLFTTPLLLAARHADAALTLTDFLAAFFMFGFILIETIADNQLYNFHQQKKKQIPADERFSQSLVKGFMVDGFWKHVRHPNFAAEQAIWVSFYFFSISASGQWLNWTISGSILLILLFVGSSEFTENISKSKYSGYEEYIKQIPRFIPLRIKQTK